MVSGWTPTNGAAAALAPANHAIDSADAGAPPCPRASRATPIIPGVVPDGVGRDQGQPGRRRAQPDRPGTRAAPTHPRDPRRDRGRCADPQGEGDRIAVADQVLEPADQPDVSLRFDRAGRAAGTPTPTAHPARQPPHPRHRRRPDPDRRGRDRRAAGGRERTEAHPIVRSPPGQTIPTRGDADGGLDQREARREARRQGTPVVQEARRADEDQGEEGRPLAAGQGAVARGSRAARPPRAASAPRRSGIIGRATIGNGRDGDRSQRGEPDPRDAVGQGGEGRVQGGDDGRVGEGEASRRARAAGPGGARGRARRRGPCRRGRAAPRRRSRGSRRRGGRGRSRRSGRTRRARSAERRGRGRAALR